ncbi:MAG TPA: hypothetical protein DEO33_05030 [Rikenellaceae bacterium]|nr:hypothetical protein [Rikenellaceae bacterium]
MKSDREFLDGIYKKAEKVDIAKTVSNEDISLLKNMGKRKISYVPRRAVQFAGSFAVLVLIFSVSGMIPQTGNQKDPRIVPRVASGVMDLTEDHPLIQQATEILEVEAEKIEKSIPLSVVGTYKKSGKEPLSTSFLEKNELGIQEGQKAILFLKV